MKKGIFWKLPSKVKVGKKAYKVEKEDLTDQRLSGLIDERLKLIQLSNIQSTLELESTLLHELIHAVDFQLNVGLSEKQVLKLEEGLVEMFRVNKWKIIN